MFGQERLHTQLKSTMAKNLKQLRILPQEGILHISANFEIYVDSICCLVFKLISYKSHFSRSLSAINVLIFCMSLRINSL